MKKHNFVISKEEWQQALGAAEQTDSVPEGFLSLIEMVKMGLGSREGLRAKLEQQIRAGTAERLRLRVKKPDGTLGYPQYYYRIKKQ